MLSLSPAPLATMDEEEDDESLSSVEERGIRCGYLGWRPNCLQNLNRPVVLVTCIAFYSLSLGFVVNGIINVNASSLERRFDLRSTDIGFISSSYDITAAFLALLTGYYGSGKRKARMVAMAIFCSALGSLILTLPHFLSDTYYLGLDSTGLLCSKNVPVGKQYQQQQMSTDVNGTTTSSAACATKGESELSNYFYVFLVGQLLHGVGGTTMFTVGIALIDDSVMPNRTPLFLGIVYGCNVLGAGLGYTIGGQFLNIYVDVDTVSNVNLTPEDQRWVGAWWLGPLIAATAQLAAAFPISLFGSELPSSKKVQHLRQNQAHMTSSMHLSTKLGGWKFLSATCRLLKNPCFVFITLSMVMEGMCMTGLAVFLPKFVENQFGVTAANAALWTGSAVIPAAAGGLVLGGWIAKHFNLDIQQSIKMIITLAVVAALCSAFIWIRCDKKKIYGVKRDYAGNPISLSPSKSLVSPCNAMCNCDTDVFQPLCGNVTHLYFSPCFAGCTGKREDQYLDCACLAMATSNDTTSGSTPSPAMTLTSDSCTEPCALIYVFILLLFFTLCLCFMPIAPGDAIQLRCVHEDFKTHAQGVKTFIVRTLGSFVGPIVVGKLLDLNCDVWRKKCGVTLSCWIYDENMLVTSLYVFILVCKGGTIIFCSLALKFYTPPPESPKEEGVEKCIDANTTRRRAGEHDYDDDQADGAFEFEPEGDLSIVGGGSSVKKRESGKRTGGDKAANTAATSPLWESVKETLGNAVMTKGGNSKTPPAKDTTV